MKARKEGSVQPPQHEGSAAQLVAGHVIPEAADGLTGENAGALSADAVGGHDRASRDAIAAEAYSLWIARGCRDDSALEDWLEAEALVHARQRDGRQPAQPR